MDRRAFARQPISLSALVHPQKGRSWLCTIRDFCRGGMLLVGAGGSRSLVATGAEPKSGDPLNVHFSIPTQTGEKHLRMQAFIVRLTDSGGGMGIRFSQELPADAFAALMDFAVASGMVSRSAAGLTKDHEEEETAATSATEGTSRADSSHGDIPETLLRDKRVREEDASRLKRAIEVLSELLFAAGAREVLTGLSRQPKASSLTELKAGLAGLDTRQLHLAAFHPTGTARAGTAVARNSSEIRRTL